MISSVFCSDQLKFETCRLGLETHRMDWRPWYGELGTVAVPILQASGSLTFDEVRLRFIVIDRLGADLDKFFKGGENPWPIHTVLRVGLMVLDSLQYVPSKGYAHNDIKVTIISIFSSHNLLFTVAEFPTRIICLISVCFSMLFHFFW